jgi:hypothetical protein
MNEKSETANCPFCGAETKLDFSPVMNMAGVSCTRGLCFEGPLHPDKAEAVREYNQLCSLIELGKAVMTESDRVFKALPLTVMLAETDKS